MPTISRFYGIVIFMNYNDHAPPHFHARYQDQEVTIAIETGLVTGKMSKRALQMLFAWLDLHQEELMANWERAREHQPLEPVPPLL
jgi:predicted P-loop ATPase/GTPase